MSDAIAMPRAGLAGTAVPGRLGAPGAAGVMLGEVVPAAVASISLRRGGGEAARAALSEMGLGLPDAGRCLVQGARTVLAAAPGRWTVIDEGGADAPAMLARALGAQADVTDLTGSRVMLRLWGPRSRDSLMKLVPIDLHERAFTAGCAATTAAARVAVQVWQSDAAPVYHLMFERSYVRYMWGAVAAAVVEYGCDVKELAAAAAGRREQRP